MEANLVTRSRPIRFLLDQLGRMCVSGVVLAILFLPTSLWAGTETNPEITDPANDQVGNQAGQNRTMDITKAWFSQPDNLHLSFFIKVSDLSGVNPNTGDGLPIDAFWKIQFSLKNTPGTGAADVYFVQMRKPETGPPLFVWGFQDANGINREQATPADNGIIDPAKGIIAILMTNSKFTGAPRGNVNPTIGNTLTVTFAITQQLVGAAGSGVLVTIDRGPNAGNGNNFTLLDVGPPPPPPTRNANYVTGGFTFSTGLRLLGSGGGQSGQNIEPNIAVDFAGNIYVTAIQGVPAGVDFWRSKNGGQTFQFMGQPDGTQNPQGSEGVGIGGGDNDIAVSTGGYVYISSLWLGSATIASSLDRGVDWRVSETPTPAIDRQWNAAVGPLTLYMTTTQIASESGLNTLILVRSDNAGLTFGPKKVIPTPPPDLQGNLVADKYTGALHNAFTVGNQLWYWSSTDGGQTFKVAKVLDNANAGNVFPITAVDYAGNVHIAWSNRKDILLTSLPAGRDPTVASNWLTPVRVNNGTETATALLPWIAAGDAGAVTVTWYGTTMTGDPGSTAFNTAQWKIFFAQTLNALSNTPTITQVVASSPEVAHIGAICTQGLNCDLTGANRNLAEYYSMTVDNDGLANIAYATDVGTPNDAGRTNFTKQTSGSSVFAARTAASPLTFRPSAPIDPTRTGAEPSVDVDSKGNILVGAITGGAKLWKSSDGGTSFRFIRLFDTDQPARGGDIDMAIDKNDKDYYVDLTLPRAAVSKSFDAGETWPQRVFTGELNDRPWLATFDNSIVYLAYHDLTIETMIIEKSTDGGLTWTKNGTGISDPNLLAETVPNTIDGEIVVDKNDGTVYLIFGTSDNIANAKQPPFGILSNVYVAVSRDGGQTFQNFPIFRGWVETVDPTVAQTKGITPEKGTNAGSIFSRIALDNAGNVYAIWASNNTRNATLNFDEFSIWFSRSTDKGKTWSTPVQVNSDRGTHVFATISAKENGKVAIAWYGTSSINDPNLFATNDPNVNWDVFVATSDNALDTRPSFTQVKANTNRSPIHRGSISTGGLTGTADRSLLDFFEMKFDNQGFAHVVWADNVNPPAGVHVIYSNSNTATAPIFAVAPTSLNFGDVSVGSSSSLTLTVTNIGTATLSISSVVSSNAEYTVTPTSGSLAPGTNQVYTVTFTPTSTGTKSGSITFTHNAAGSPTSVPVTGNGVSTAPAFSVAPTSLNFGNVIIGANKVDILTVTNTGTATLTISSVTSSNSQFSVTPTSGSLAPSASQVFSVTFTPTSTGLQSGNIVFTHNASGSPSSVPVSGTGVAAAPIIFSPSVTGTAPEDPRSGEPSIVVDRDGFVYAGGIRGLTSGGGDLWRWDSKNDPCLRTPFYIGETVQRDPANVGGIGGGDGALAISQPTNPNAIPVVTFAGLTLANVTIQISFDRGNTWEISEAGDLIFGGEVATDRHWLTGYGESTVYLSYRSLASATVSDLFVATSIDHGRTWTPKSVVRLAANSTPGSLDVDRRPIGSGTGAGNIYYSHQNSSTMFVSVAPPSPIPGVSQTGGPLTFTTFTVDNSTGHGHLFDVVRVGTDGTVYACWSNDFNIFFSRSTDQGRTWSTKVQVNAANTLDANGRTVRTNLFPWMVAGDPGRVGIAWFGSNGVNNGDNNSDWAVYYASTSNGLSATPTWTQVQASDGYIHAGNLSESGLGSGTANNRNLLDFFMVDKDPSGAAVITYADDHNDFDGQTYVTRQVSGPSLLASIATVPSTTCPAVPFDHNPLRLATDPEVIDFRRDAQLGRRGTLQADDPLDLTGIKYIDTVSSGGQRQLAARIFTSLMTSPPPEGFHWFAWFTANAPNNLFDRGQSFYVEASTDQADTASAVAPRFFYGTSARRTDGGFTLTRQPGTADGGVFDAASNSVTIFLGLNKINAIANPPIGDNSRLIGLRGLSLFGTLSVTTPAVLGTLTGSDLQRDFTRGGIEFFLVAKPIFTVVPTSLNFGNVNVGASKTEILTVTNTGTAPLTITSVTSDNDQFTVTPASGTVAPSASQQFSVTFSPTSTGTKSGNIVFTHNAQGSPTSVPVTGVGVAPAFSVQPTSLDFGNVNVGSNKTDSVTVTNTGTATLNITSVSSDNNQFSVTPTSGSLAPSANQKFFITFSPTSTGTKSGNIIFTHNAASSPDSVTVSGTGVQPKFSVSPNCIDFGTVTVGSSKTDSVTVTNTGTATLIIDSVKSDNSQFSATPTSGSVAPSASQKFFISFTPTSAGAKAGNVVFFHNAPGSPDSVCVSGTGMVITMTTLDCNDTAITMFGGWHRVDDARATNGFYCRNVGAKKSNSGAYLSFTFTGFEVDMQIARGPRGGNAEVFIDGVSQGKVDFFRPASDSSHPDNSGKKDLTFDIVVSYNTTQGQHTFRLNVLNDTPEPEGALRDMIYVDGFVIIGGTTQGTATISESSTQTQGNVGGSSQSSQSTSSSSSTLLLTGILEVPDGVNLDLRLLDPLGLLVAQSSTLKSTEVVRFTLSVAGLFDFQVANMSLTPGAFTLYVVTTKAVIAAPKSAAQSPAEKPTEFALAQNYPNPFNPTTTVRYDLPADSYVLLKVYNALGQEVASLANEQQQAGRYAIHFDASRLSSGVYFYKIIAGNFAAVKRMLIIK